MLSEMGIAASGVETGSALTEVLMCSARRKIAVQHEGAGMYRVLTGDGSRTTTELVEMAVQSGVRVKSLSVQNTTLDDVFVHYTGRQLRDELQKAYGFVMPQRPGLQP